MDHEQSNDRVHLEYRVGEPYTAGNSIVDPAVRDPPGHEAVQCQRGRDGRPLKILRLARRILWYYLRRDVEASQSRQAAEDEEGETEVVQRCADTNCECDDCWSDAE